MEFIVPIFNDETEIERKFYLSGFRHCMDCDGEDCNKSVEVVKGEKLRLEIDSNNKYDANATLVFDSNNNIVGYIPRYYSKQVNEFFLKEL